MTPSPSATRGLAYHKMAAGVARYHTTPFALNVIAMILGNTTDEFVDGVCSWDDEELDDYLLENWELFAASFDLFD